ncbi:Uncharacterized protein TCM_033268 [Theobroma cacao]|uniref:Uncharacterized protein n=1 Tax=Theobroma cacao TaxID=3641 RepID=A0A061F9P2_THECC|nr:Uncharacterized protein TCM_033268 [Theobroma cacao]
MAGAECLIDYSENSNKRKDPLSRTSSSSSNSGAKFPRVSRPSSGKGDRRPPTRDSPQPRNNKQWNFKPRPLISYFLCKEPHRVADCPHQVVISVICITNVKTPLPHTIVEKAKEEPTQMGSICFLSVLQAQLEKMEKEPQRGLTYVEVLLNEKSTKAMVDMGASNTFITSREAKRCGLKVDKDFGR